MVCKKKGRVHLEALGMNVVLMQLSRPGNLTVSCRAALEEAGEIKGDGDHILVNALIYSSKPVQESCQHMGVLRVAKGLYTDPFIEGIYDIFATVELLSCIYRKGIDCT